MSNRNAKRAIDRAMIKAVKKFDKPMNADQLGLNDEAPAPVVEEKKPAYPAPTEMLDPQFIPSKLTALGDFIPVVKPEDYIEGNTLIPEVIQKDNTYKCIIIAVGKDFDKDYNVGDIVIFKPGTQSTEIKGKQVMVMNDFNIIGKYEI